MTVLNQHGLASGVNQVRPPSQVGELAAPVQLDAVKAIAHQSIYVTLHVSSHIWEVVLRAAGKEEGQKRGDDDVRWGVKNR